MSEIYHLTRAEAWQQACAAGEYRPESLASEGFIHLSERHQILGVANAFYHAQVGLLILVVETNRLQAPLRFEPPVHPAGPAASAPPPSEALFPHLYGPLNLQAVARVIPFPSNLDGTFSLPPALAGD